MVVASRVAWAWASCPIRGVPKSKTVTGYWGAIPLFARPPVHPSPTSRNSFHVGCQNGKAYHYSVLESHCDGVGVSDPQGREYDAVMVLGGGLCSDGGIPEWVTRRLDGALKLYVQSPCPILLLGAGTPHKPPVLDTNGYLLHESTVYANYLLQRGVPSLDLLKETSSYDTVGNAYFSLTMHVLPAGWHQVAVVTSEFHMPRTMQTFKDCYALGSQQNNNTSLDRDIIIDFFAVSDDNLFTQDVLEARREKEALALATWKQNFSSISTLPELHSWLFATHLCYSVSRQHEFGKTTKLDSRLAATY